MRKINLKAKNISVDGSSYENSPSGKISLIVGLIVLLLAGLLYGGVAYLRSSQKKQIATTKAEINNLKKNLDTNKDFKVLYDFQDRLMQLSVINDRKVRHINVLNQLAQSTLGVNVVKSLKNQVDDGLSTLNVVLSSPDLATVAKQINAYKEISSRGEVFLNEVNAKEEGIEMSVRLVLPKSVPGAKKKTDMNL